jgi:nitroreductase
MTEMMELIKSRRSLRAPYDPRRPVEPEKLAQILEAARWSPSAHNMQNFEIVVVDDPQVLEAIAHIERPVSETFVRENYAQLSSSEEELLQRKTGILGTMFPPSWRKPDFRLADLSAEEIAATRRPLPASPLLLVVVYDPSRRAPASEGDFLGIMSLGCVMENMWLAAESLGIGMHIVSSLSSGGEVKEILGVPERLMIAFSCRLGYPEPVSPPYLRVRREVAAFTHHNRYGS